MKMNSKAETFSKLRVACRDLKQLAVHGTVYGITASSVGIDEYTGKAFVI